MSIRYMHGIELKPYQAKSVLVPQYLLIPVIATNILGKMRLKFPIQTMMKSDVSRV